MYLFADRHLAGTGPQSSPLCVPSALKLPRQREATPSGQRVNACLLNGLLVAVAAWSLWKRSVIGLELAQAPTPYEREGLRRFIDVPLVDLAHLPPFLRAWISTEVPDVTDTRGAVARFFKPTTDYVVSRFEDAGMGLGRLEGRLLAVLVELGDRQPFLRSDAGTVITSIDVLGYLARSVGGSASLDCRAEAKAAGCLTRPDRGADPRAAELRRFHDEVVDDWRQSRAADPDLHNALCHRALVGVVLKDRLFSD